MVCRLQSHQQHIQVCLIHKHGLKTLVYNERHYDFYVSGNEFPNVKSIHIIDCNAI
jgi:hypothetical protein